MTKQIEKTVAGQYVVWEENDMVLEFEEWDAAPTEVVRDASMRAECEGWATFQC